MTAQNTDEYQQMSKAVSEWDRRKALVAHHEAGHAILAIKLDVTFGRVTIAPNADSLGHITLHRLLKRGDLEWGGDVSKKWRIDRAMLIVLAGPYAQKRQAPQSRWRTRNYIGFNGGGDFDRVINLKWGLHEDDKVAKKYLQYMEAWTEQLVERYWPNIEAVAQALMERETLTYAETRTANWEALKI